MDSIQHPINVLVADDDAPTRILLKAAISQWGYNVIEAKDGEEAWAIMNQKNAPRILILDWLMPKIDGITLCERSRKELTVQPFIILLTQMSGSTNAVKGIELGADEFLSKPFNMAELKSRLSIGSRIIISDEQNTLQQLKLNYISDSIAALNSIAKKVRHLTKESANNEELLKLIVEFQIILNDVKFAFHKTNDADKKIENECEVIQ